MIAYKLSPVQGPILTFAGSARLRRSWSGCSAGTGDVDAAANPHDAIGARGDATFFAALSQRQPRPATRAAPSAP